MDTIAEVTSSIVLQRATADDCKRIFEWRNAKVVRQGCTDSRELEYSSHQEWYEKALKDKKRIILLACIDQIKMGVLRFDYLDPTTCEVSIFLDPNWIGKGWGEKLLVAGEWWLKNENMPVKKLVATILEVNQPSKRAFTNLNYQCLSSTYIKEL